MSTYLERIAEVQSDYDQIRKLINLYQKSRLNNGWLETQQNYSNTTLTGLIGDLDSTSIYKENPGTTSAPVTSEFYDIPMLCKAYDKDLRMGYGAPADIGFAKNVKYGWDVTNWVGNRICETHRSWKCVCYGMKKFVAVADNSYFAYSLDGINWTESTISSTSRQWESVCCNYSKFVAVANITYFAYSSDGINWTEGTISSTSRSWIFVGFGNGVCIALSVTNYFAYSYDGINWTESTISSTSRQWRSVCYGNGKFVAVAYNSNISAYSTNGTTWIESPMSIGSRYWTSVCYGNDKFVAVAENSVVFYYSYDGITWAECRVSDTSRYWTSICYGKDKFVAVAAHNSTGFAYSSDGITWTEAPSTSRQSVCYGDNKFVAVVQYSVVSYSCTPTSSYEPHKPLYQVRSTSYRFDNASYSATTTTGGTVAMTRYNNKLIVSPNRFSSYPSEFTQTTDDVIVNPPNHTNWDYLITNNQLFFIGPITDANHLHLFYCFVSMNTSYGGFCLYVTPNFVNWNLHTIIPTSASSTQRTALFGSSTSSYTVSTANATIMQNALQKYFRVLPNNNYIVMYPLPMYTGTDKTTMAYMYSPWDPNPIAVIKDPYDTTEEYVDKATKGITCYLTENGEVVLYYNSRPETPLSLYGGRVMSTFDGSVLTNYKREIVNVPKVGRHYAVPDMTTKSLEITTDDVAIDCAIGILESKNGSLSEDDIPAAAVTLALGDAAQKLVDNSEFGDDYQKFDSINLYVPRSIENLDNIDMDMTDYIEKLKVNGEDVEDGEDGENLLSKMEWKECAINNRSWDSMCYGNGTFIAVPYNSDSFAYSSDGITWSAILVNSTNRGWRGVCYGNDKFIAVSCGVYNSETYEWGGTTTFIYSSDGINWTEGTIGNTARQWYSVCYGNNIWVALALNNSRALAYSYDGINWTESSISASNFGSSICYGNGRFISPSTYNYNYSLDGITWTTGYSSTTVYWSDYCYGNDKFVGVSGSSGVAYYSLDGITWTEVTMPSSNDWRHVCYGNGKFVAIVYRSNIFAYSFDGINWIEGTINSNEIYWNCVCYGKDKFVAIGNSVIVYLREIGTASLSFNQNNLYLKYADEYPNIRQRITTVNNSLYEDASKLTNDPGIRNGEFGGKVTYGGVQSSRQWISVCYGNGKFIAVASSSTIFAYSLDGITWVGGTISSTTRSWTFVCYGNDKFVAIAYDSNYFAYSLDGITWNESTISSTSRYWNSVCYGKDKFVAVAGNTNYFAYSSDGITWNESTISTSRQWRSVCYGNDKFVVVSTGSIYSAYSSDGITWTESPISSRSWWSVCYGKDKFVAVAQSTNYFAYSSDGITWNEGTISSTSRNWWSVCYGKNKFVAIARNSSVVAYSSDGITWIESDRFEDMPWQSICYHNNKFVSVSNTSSIMCLMNFTSIF